MPPKVSKKRKVGRDLPSGNKINEEQDNSDEIEEEDEDQSVQADGKSSQDKDDRVWVQCNNCDRQVIVDPYEVCPPHEAFV